MIDIKFTKVIIHHFLSFDHAEVELTDKGYCLVSGLNRNPKDSAKSNGAGKSTMFNAISYALTGETLQGLKTNLPNIYFNDGCYVQVEFIVDGHKYSLLRSKDDTTYGTNLKITVDGEDKSGKGIRESQAMLDQLLPDLTSELLGSVVMIGQGMPMKFTANTPAGRKEVLEHLSQSDFMIQDLKERISNRSSALSKQLREVEDTLLSLSSQESVYFRQLTSAKGEYENKYVTTPDFDGKITELTNQEAEVNKELGELEKEFTENNNKIEELSSKLLKVTKEKSDYATKFNNEHAEVHGDILTRKAQALTKQTSLKNEIEKLKSIKDVCPTCGQKIPGAVKPDTTELEKQLAKATELLAAIIKEGQEDDLAYDAIMQELEIKYASSIESLETEINNLKAKVNYINPKKNLLNSKLSQISIELNGVKKDKEFFDTNKQRVLDTVAELEKHLSEIKIKTKEQADNRDVINSHIEVVKKMTTIITHDFRGFLLKNIIEYINAKAKEYTAKIFGCDEISFVLDGNNIDISFCGKDYENLSGGEKQRVDLIIQFAIRDFMSQYLQFSSNILVLDEITDALDAESCDKVINFITEELKDIESVFIISHHADELAIPVDSEIVIEKNTEGVSCIL